MTNTPTPDECPECGLLAICENCDPEFDTVTTEGEGNSYHMNKTPSPSDQERIMEKVRALKWMESWGADKSLWRALPDEDVDVIEKLYQLCEWQQARIEQLENTIKEVQEWGHGDDCDIDDYDEELEHCYCSYKHFKESLTNKPTFPLPHE